jgi:hypothetical protein
MKFKLSILILIIILIFLSGCMSSIKPLELPVYKAPDLSMLKRPEIPPLIEGIDYTIDVIKGTVTYTITGQDKLTAKVISEAAAYRVLDLLKQVVDVQTQLIIQKDQLIIQIDLQRQIAEKGQERNEIKAILSEIVAFIGVALAVAAVASGL